MHRGWVASWSVCASMACSFNAGGVTVGNQGVDDDTTAASTTAAATTGDPPTPTTGDNSDGTGGSGVCSPGAVTPCACPDGDGSQTCSEDGLSQGPCDCPAAPTTTAVDPGTTTEPDPTTSTTADDASTTAAMEPCDKDKGEPNDTPDKATHQSKQDCNDELRSFDGILESDGDIDWHDYDGGFPQQCNSGLQAWMAYTLTADPQVRLCVFADCAKGFDGNEGVVCGSGSSGAEDTPGRGCCGQGDFDMFLFCGNDTFDHSAKVTLRLDGGPAQQCSPYSVSYAYP